MNQHIFRRTVWVGREVRMPADVIYGFTGSVTEDVPKYCDSVEYVQSRMLHTHAVARRYLQSSAKRSEAIYDTNVVLHAYKPGDLVWCLHETRKVGVPPKLEIRYFGPYLITERSMPYRYLECGNEDRLVGHVLKHHIPFNRAPYYCSFRCTQKK